MSMASAFPVTVAAISSARPRFKHLFLAAGQPGSCWGWKGYELGQADIGALIVKAVQMLL